MAMTPPESSAIRARPMSRKRPAIDQRALRHSGYTLALKHRKRSEEASGLAKTVGGTAQMMYRGLGRPRALPADDGRQHSGTTPPPARCLRPKNDRMRGLPGTKPWKMENPPS